MAGPEDLDAVGRAKLPRLLADVGTVLAVPTPLEAEPMLALLETERVFAVAGKTWRVGRVAGAAGRVLVVITGYDKANVAHALTCVFEAHRPSLIVLFGIAGGFPPARPGDLALATREIYADTGASSVQGWLSTQDLGLPLAEMDGRAVWNEFPVASDLIGSAREALEEVVWGESPPAVVEGPFVTTSRVSGTVAEAEELTARWNPVAETMEGAAAAHVCLLYGIPFLEVRGISNTVGPRDRGSWLVGPAAERAARAAVAFAAALSEIRS